MKRLLELVPILGVALFAGLYFYAASLYPGGTRLDHASKGYAHFANYWCDLLDETSYAGLANPGRTLALAATVLLPVTLIPFWYFLPALFPESGRSRTVVSVSGIASMVCAAFLPVAHDRALDGASAFLLVAILGSAISLFRSREFTVLGLLALAAGTSIVNFVMWKTGYRPDVMPVVQKAAILFSFAWIATASFRYRVVLQGRRCGVD